MDMGVWYFIWFIGGAVALARILHNEKTRSRLPAVFYFLAKLTALVLFLFPVWGTDKPNTIPSMQFKVLLASIFGTVLSMVVVGRLIQLLQQIRDK